MSFFLFVLIIIAAVIAVRIGAIALELTGIEKRTAQFQAISCFTGTGFTTREAEVIMASPQRRKIASVLMIVGFAGFVSLIGTFAISIKDHTVLLHSPLNFLSPLIPNKYYIWINLGLYLVVGLVLWRVFKSTRLAARAEGFLRNWIQKKKILAPVTFNEMIVATGGWGVCQVDIREGNPMVGKTFFDLELQKHKIYPLAIEKKQETISMPPAQTRLEKNDHLICFGKIIAIRKMFLEKEEPEE